MPDKKSMCHPTDSGEVGAGKAWTDFLRLRSALPGLGAFLPHLTTKVGDH